MDELERLVGAVDRLDWRFVRDLDDWSAYFHPDWKSNPERIVIAEGAEPSRNEIACVTLLRHALPALPSLLRVARAAEAVQAALAATVKDVEAVEQARIELAAALTDLNDRKPARV